MTTIVGIETRLKEKSAIVLASDVTGTADNLEDHGDVILRRKTQSNYTKLYASKNEQAILGMAGTIDERACELLTRAIAGEIEFEKIVRDGFFPEMRDLHIKRSENKVLKSGDTNSILLAYKGEDQVPRLYTCWPLGLVEHREGTAIGSGSDYAFSFINGELARSLGQIDITTKYEMLLPRGIELAVGAVRHAARDIYTKGLDLKILTPEGVRSYGKRITDALDAAERDTLSQIIKENS